MGGLGASFVGEWITAGDLINILSLIFREASGEIERVVFLGLIRSKKTACTPSLELIRARHERKEGRKRVTCLRRVHARDAHVADAQHHGAHGERPRAVARLFRSLIII